MSTDIFDQGFWEGKNLSFKTATPADDLLHLEFKGVNPAPALTETQYFGFSVPEADIHAMTYLWHHANLGVVSGGAWAWQGIKSHALQAELIGWTDYMDDEVLAKDLWDYEFDNGYHVQTIEPLKKHRLRYRDDERKNHFDVELEALMEPMVLQTGMHLEQAMRVRGELTLRGKTYGVDCTNVRDRSWGQSRSERHAPTPPIDWLTGVFSNEFIFSLTAYDHPDLSPEWKGHVQIPGDDPTTGGWVYRDGELVPIVSARKRVEHDFSTMVPTSVELVMTDSRGREYEIRGDIVSANRISVWTHLETWICLARWECEGQVCYGDLQSVVWHDYIYRFLGSN